MFVVTTVAQMLDGDWGLSPSSATCFFEAFEIYVIYLFLSIPLPTFPPPATTSFMPKLEIALGLSQPHALRWLGNKTISKGLM